MELRDSLRREQGRASSRRVALYSHDTQGLGHIRRNTLLAAAMVAADPEVDVLLLSGAREAASLPLPERTDLVVLPGLTKDALGGYAARCLDRSLGEVLAIRAAALESLLAAYEPDLLVVDKVPRGFRGELEPALRRARLEHGTRTVLGLRDILDDVSTTRREWQIARTPEAIRTLYDQVWVYADPTVFDPAVEYGWSEAVRTKVRYTGYLGADRERLLPTTKHSSITPSVSRDNAGPFVLGLIGGGQDGAAVADAFAHADFPAGHVGVLVTGPYLPSTHLEHLERLARHRRDLRVHRFVNDVPALARASRATVSMGGYNSVCELMTARRPALVVPRVAPRSEQSIRATHFADRGLLDVLFPQHLDPQALSGWLRAAVSRVAPPSRSIDLGGLGRVPDLVTALLESSVVQGARDVG
ncbi:hypothetical protein [Nocardioides sp.]|uniref:glycosyltransferase family protein n=1 Tax=Nocardioides sp. TaxID=35761 RepID=UPI00286E5852|nr:hypothetical protein [Nocardioides sp.]